MSRYLYYFIGVGCCLLALLFPATVGAQESQQQTTLLFEYVDHEPSTSGVQLGEIFSQERYNALQFETSMIVYLANGQNSLVSLTGIKDKTGKNVDDKDAFDNIIYELESFSWHRVDAEFDRDKIIKLFDEYVFGPNFQSRYSKVTLRFYVGAQFWRLRNKRIIENLLDYPEIRRLAEQGVLQIQVFMPVGENLPSSIPFSTEVANRFIPRVMEY
jgi:hypothetical protein